VAERLRLYARFPKKIVFFGEISVKKNMLRKQKDQNGMALRKQKEQNGMA
jgi:hypothetical protein